MYCQAVVEVIGILLMHPVDEGIRLPRGVDVDCILSPGILINLRHSVTHFRRDVSKAVTLDLIVNGNLLSSLGNGTVFAIAKDEAAGRHVKLVYLSGCASGRNIIDGSPGFIAYINLNGASHNRIARMPVFSHTRDEGIATSKLLVFFAR